MEVKKMLSLGEPTLKNVNIVEIPLWNLKSKLRKYSDDLKSDPLKPRIIWNPEFLKSDFGDHSTMWQIFMTCIPNKSVYQIPTVLKFGTQTFQIF